MKKKKCRVCGEIVFIKDSWHICDSCERKIIYDRLEKRKAFGVFSHRVRDRRFRI